jgi:hypothetical protein
MEGVPVRIPGYLVPLECVFQHLSPSWTAFQADGGRDFSVIVDGVFSLIVDAVSVGSCDDGGGAQVIF